MRNFKGQFTVLMVLVVLGVVGITIPNSTHAIAEAREVEEVRVIGTRPIPSRPSQEVHRQVREWLASSVGEIQARIEQEAGRVSLCDDGTGDCLYVSVTEWLIMSIAGWVNSVDSCISESLSQTDLKKASPHRIEYRRGADTHGEYDPLTGSYVTVLDPVTVNDGSSSNLFEKMVHEYTHHITYDPETGIGTQNHGPDFWDKYHSVRYDALGCRGVTR